MKIPRRWVQVVRPGLEKNVRPAGENQRPVDQESEKPGKPRLAGPKRSHEENFAIVLLYLGQHPRDQGEQGKSVGQKALPRDR